MSKALVRHPPPPWDLDLLLAILTRRQRTHARTAQATLAKNCGGFSGTYQALCDYYGIPVRADICWDMDNLLPANHVKKFNMKEFEQVHRPRLLLLPASSNDQRRT
jgi:hypothetical protein